jgi:hypothetical protein
MQQSSQPRPRLVTTYWQALWDRSKEGRLPVQPVRVSLDIPRFWPEAAKFPFLADIAPSAWMLAQHKGEQHWRFAAAYEYKLNMCGVARIEGRLRAFDSALPLALTCFEPNADKCHRAIFSRWWYERTGQIIDEWVPHQPVTPVVTRFGIPS